MQVINGLEEAEECATNYYGTSWDKKRAFDSLSRNAGQNQRKQNREKDFHCYEGNLPL
jgi:hypothetical protein